MTAAKATDRDALSQALQLPGIRSSEVPSQLGLPSFASDRLADRTADLLRSLIVSGELRAGQRLVEWQLADQLGISRGPVRDAFRELAKEGLLRNIPRRGTYVASLTVHDAHDLLNLRAGIEACAARLIIARADPEAIAQLEAAATDLSDACREGDDSEITGAHYNFHETVCRVTGNPRLHTVFVRYVTELRVLLRFDEERLHEAGVDFSGQHLALLRALQHEDALTAADAFWRHVDETAQRVLSSLSAHPVTAEQHGRQKAD